MEQYITEKWSHSEDMDNALECVYGAITNSIPGARTETIIDMKLNLIIGDAYAEVFGMQVKISYYIYDAADKETMYMAKKELEHTDGVDEANNEIIITLYALNGEIHEQTANITLSHELEHILQISKGREKNRNYKQLTDNSYELTFSILANQGLYSETEKNVAWAFYYSNPHEQDAFVNEHYYGLCNGKEHLRDRNTPVHNVLRKYRTIAKRLLLNLQKNDQQTLDTLKRYRKYGYTPSNFRTMLIKGMSRFRRKVANIEKHFADTDKLLKEQNWKYGQQSYFGSIRKFKPTIL